MTNRPKPVKYLNTEEIKALFGAITDARDRAIFRVVYHRGLRASELSSSNCPTIGSTTAACTFAG